MIYLMRHGQDDEHFIGGWSNVALIPEGIKQVNENGIWIRDNLSINKIISSSVYRAVQSARIVNSYLNVPFILDDNLREQNKGLLNGMDKEEAELKYKDFLENVDINTTYPQGESLKDLYERIRKYLEFIIKLDDDTLVVTHRGVINMIYYLFNDIPIDMEKGRFDVGVASIHSLDKEIKKIKRIK